MTPEKRAALEAAGYRFGTAAEFVGMTEAELDAAIERLREARALREVEQITPRGAELERYVAEHPAPPEWYEEPGWEE